VCVLPSSFWFGAAGFFLYRPHSGESRCKIISSKEVHFLLPYWSSKPTTLASARPPPFFISSFPCCFPFESYRAEPSPAKRHGRIGAAAEEHELILTKLIEKYGVKRKSWAQLTYTPKADDSWESSKQFPGMCVYNRRWKSHVCWLSCV
jgi:hypothetical protein